MENMVGNLFPRGIPIPFTHIQAHISLDYSFLCEYLVSAHSCAGNSMPCILGDGDPRMNMPCGIIWSSTISDG